MVESKKKYLTKELVAAFVGAPLLVGILIAIEKGLWPDVTFWVGAVLTTIFSIIIVNYALNPGQLLEDIEKDLKLGEAGDYYLLGIPILHYWAAVLLFRGIRLHFGAEMYVGLPESPSLITDMSFVANRLLGVVLVDALEIFGFHLSTVEHAKLFWMSLTVFLYNVVVSIGFVSILVTSFNRIVRSVR